MYYEAEFEDTIGVPPPLFGLKSETAVLQILRERYERTISPWGIILIVESVRIKSPGRIYIGNSAAYYDVTFKALLFQPQVGEVVEGEVMEIVEFGAFVRLGPIDGLLHVSQIASEYFTYDKRRGCLIGKQSKRTIKAKDLVRARIAAASLKETIPASKLALTMKGEGLGKIKKGD